jgi:ankyrin repeat protein
MEEIDKQLFAAARRGAADDVAALLKQGANAKAVNFMRVTPLMIATLGGHLNCVIALLPSSDARAVDEEGCSALIYASQHNRLECAKALLPSSDVEQMDYEGRAALDHAKNSGDVELVDLISSYELARREALELRASHDSNAPSIASPRL